MTATRKSLKRSATFAINDVRVHIVMEVEEGGPAARTVDLTMTTDPVKHFSMTGNYAGHSGQCADTICKAGKGIPALVRLCALWERWHLNDMCAGTRLQNKILENYQDELKDSADRYKERCRILTEHRKYLDEETAPGQSYKYGSAWLYEPLPDEIVAEVSDLLNVLNDQAFTVPPDVEEPAGDKDSKDILQQIPPPPAEAVFRLEKVETIVAPHPYCITPRHIAVASDRYGGILDAAAIERAEQDGAVCDTCRNIARRGGRAPLSFKQHEKMKTLFIAVPQNKDLNAVSGLHKYLLEVKARCEELGIQSFAFPTR